MNIQNIKARRAISEQADNYPNVVVQSGFSWRVIECRNGIQWIIQIGPGKVLAGARWRSQSCRTKNALIGSLQRHMGEIDPNKLAILDALPERIGVVE